MDYLSLKYLPRYLLRQGNEFFSMSRRLMIERDIPLERLTSKKFIEKRLMIANTFFQNFLILHFETNKIKYLLQRINVNLMTINEFRSLHGGTYSDIQNYRFPPNLVQKSTEGLKTITSKQVLYSDRLVHETAILIQRLCERPKIQYQTGVLLGRLFRNKPILLGTDELVKGFLHKNLLYEDFLNEKLKEIVLKQLKDPRRRQELTNLIVNFINSETVYNNMTDQLSSVLNSESTMQTVNQKIKGSIYGSLQDPETIKNFKQKVDSYFDPVKSK